nr:immunoglobulin heavy chain junction region [Mus musculus]MBK4184977.1 immunoglobulin heavy chain junction region [Mus musculus]
CTYGNYVAWFAYW